MNGTKNTNRKAPEAAMGTIKIKAGTKAKDRSIMDKVANRRKAHQRGAELKRDIETQIRRIQGALNANHAADWADVGDLAQVLEDVKNAADFINGTNDED